MLRLSDDIRFLTTATVNLKALSATFKVECRLLPPERLRRFQKEQQALFDRLRVPGLADEEQDKTLDELESLHQVYVSEFLTGWPEGEVTGSDDQPLVFGERALGQLLALPSMPRALVNGFHQGYEVATEGNSAPLSAG